MLLGLLFSFSGLTHSFLLMQTGFLCILAYMEENGQHQHSWSLYPSCLWENQTLLGSLGSKSKFSGKNSDWPNSDGLPLLVQSCSWKWGLGRKAHDPWDTHCNHVDVQFLEKELLGGQPSRIHLHLVGVSQACTCTTVQTSQLHIFLRGQGLSVSFCAPSQLSLDLQAWR